VDFVLDGNEIRGLEQNPETKSRWAQMARSGEKVMQFQRRALRSERCGWECEFLRRARLNASETWEDLWVRNGESLLCSVTANRVRRSFELRLKRADAS
jgi:hypothetical protein